MLLNGSKTHSSIAKNFYHSGSLLLCNHLNRGRAFRRLSPFVMDLLSVIEMNFIINI